MTKISISKIDAAKRQLETAIKLFFREEDPISIHTLACAAHEIITVTAKLQNIHTIIKNNPFIEKKDQKFFHDKVMEASIFFKHGNRDTKKNLDFNSDITTYFLIDAVEAYIKLSNEKPPYMVAFRIWFKLEHPNLFKESQGNLSQRLKQIGLKPSNKRKFFEFVKFLESEDF